jgi:hypothetical protein
MENFFAKPTFGSNAPHPRKTRLSERVWERSGKFLGKIFLTEGPGEERDGEKLLGKFF